MATLRDRITAALTNAGVETHRGYGQPVVEDLVDVVMAEIERPDETVCDYCDHLLREHDSLGCGWDICDCTHGYPEKEN